MALPHALRKGPQICSAHPRKGGDQVYFQPDQGKFITDNRRGTRFFCFKCLNDRAKRQAQNNRAEESKSEYIVYSELSRAGLRFTPNYRIGKWRYDLALPELRLLIELDDPPTHDTQRGKARDKFKDEFAKEHDWTVKHVRLGPGLVERCNAAYAEHKASLGA